MSAAQVLQTYFAETMGGDLPRWTARSPRRPITFSSPSTTARCAMYCRGQGGRTDREGIEVAYGALLAELEILDATQDAVIEAGEHVAVFGTFRYRARSTGRVVDSAWSVHARVHDGAIVFYRFYEDSYAVAAAIAA